MRAETNKAKAREFLESVDNLDFDSLRAAMARGFVASANGGGSMTSEKYEDMVRGITTAFSQSRHLIETQVAEGDRVATRLTWTAVHIGKFNGVAATNRPVRIAGGAFDRFKDGKLVEHHVQFDAMGLMVQIGTIPMTV